MSLVGVIVLIAVLVLASAAGFVIRARQGQVRRPRASTAPSGWDLAGRTPGEGDQVLLLQLSSPTCAPCHRTRVQLRELASERRGLRHVEIDVAEAPEIARALHVLRTPTTIAFDREGRELLRVGGVPRRTELLDALDGHGTRSR